MPAVATLADLVADVAAHDGARPAIIFGDQHVTYAQLDGAIDAVANALAARGVDRGDRVALLLPNIPQFVVAYYAILRCGAIVVPLNVLYKAEEIRYILNDSEASVFIVFEGLYSYAAEAVTEAPSVEHVVVVERALSPRGRPGGTRSPTGPRRGALP